VDALVAGENSLVRSPPQSRYVKPPADGPCAKDHHRKADTQSPGWGQAARRALHLEAKVGGTHAPNGLKRGARRCADFFAVNKRRADDQIFVPLCASFVPRNFCQGFVIRGG
jgi:hypothetical protein